jgi:hypothetical protein
MKNLKAKGIGFVVMVNGEFSSEDTELYVSIDDAKEYVENASDAGDFSEGDNVTIHRVGPVLATASFTGVKWEGSEDN